MGGSGRGGMGAGRGRGTGTAGRGRRLGARTMVEVLQVRGPLLGAAAGFVEALTFPLERVPNATTARLTVAFLASRFRAASRSFSCCFIRCGC